MFTVCRKCGKALPDTSFSTVWCDPCLDEYIVKNNITKDSPRAKSDIPAAAKSATVVTKGQVR